MYTYQTSSNGIPDITTEKWQETGWKRVTCSNEPKVALNPRVLQWGQSLCTWGAHSTNWTPGAFPSVAIGLIPPGIIWCVWCSFVTSFHSALPQQKHFLLSCWDCIKFVIFAFSIVILPWGSTAEVNPICTGCCILKFEQMFFAVSGSDFLSGLVCFVTLKLTWCTLSAKPHLGHFCLTEGVE